ncbi:MAG: hypothetical protein Kow00108_20000 [Calditrichia bacterium]
MDYFPLVDGAVYIYNNGESKRVVEFVRKENDVDLFKINNFQGDTAFVMMDYYLQKNSITYWYGFRSLDYGLVYFNPPIPMVPDVSRKDSVFTLNTKEIRKDGVDEYSYALKITFQYLGDTEITVPAGTFRCMHWRFAVKYTNDIPDISLMDIGGDWYFSRGVGLVLQNSSEFELRLTSFEQ